MFALHVSEYPYWHGGILLGDLFQNRIEFQFKKRERERGKELNF